MAVINDVCRDMNLKLEHITDSNMWKLLEDFQVPIGPQLIVPKDTLTDLASIPKCLRWFIDNDEDGVIQSAVTHDYIYAVDIKPRWYTTKASADKLFYNLLRYYGMGYFKAQTAYIAVKLFGKGNFK